MAPAIANRPLTASQAQRYTQVQQLLRAGQREPAIQSARVLLAEAPGTADAHHLLAMCLADSERDAEAEASFRQALSLAPASMPILLNFTIWLRRHRRGGELLSALHAALGRVGHDAALLMQVGMVELESGQPAQAIETFSRLVVQTPRSPAAWLALGNAQRAGDRGEQALSSFVKAVEIDATYIPGWVNLGATQRELGRVDDALESFSRATAHGYAAADFLDAIAGTLADAGRPGEALAMARETIARYPDFAPAHVNLAHLSWEFAQASSPSDDPSTGLALAAAEQPGNRALQTAYVRLLLDARRGDQAVEQSWRLRRSFGDDLISLWLAADAHVLAGQQREAGVYYEHALHLGGRGNAAFLNACARYFLGVSRPDLAGEHATRATVLDPSSQEAWALLSTAWRLLDDPREFWLCDYERFVGFVEVEPPAGVNQQAFLETLAITLEDMHRAGRAPINQTLRNGSQTRGLLFGRNMPAIVAAESALRRAVDAWRTGLPHDGAHPFLGRNGGRLRYSGSWSVKLRSSGRHSNHVHPLGWLSSAFYVSLPDSIGHSEGDAGCLQLGQPLEDLGLSLAPRRVIRPQPGWLALFPSYMWHGTVPFSDEVSRLTVAFDMLTEVPAATGRD